MEKRRLTTPPAGVFDTAPAFAPDGRTLAFVRYWGDTSDLYLLRLGADYRPQGEQKVSFSTEEPYVYAADWLPDGREIVFSRTHYGGSGSLWRIATSGSAKPRGLGITSESATVLAISGNGGRLAYTVPNAKSSIWRIDPRGPGKNPAGPSPLIRSTRNQEYPAFSPDGRRIAFATDIAGRDEIWVCDSDGSNAAQLTSMGWHPKWSHNGRNIVFLARFGGNVDVCVVSANGGSYRRLGIGEVRANPWPSWSSDGRIYFRSARAGQSEIWSMPAGGGDPLQITRNGGDIPLESPDGKFLYYMKGDRYPQQCSVWRMPAAGGEETRVADSTACIPFDVGERGLYYFAPHKKEGTDINVYDFAIGERRKILTITQPPLSITVSPDGRTILYTQKDQAGSDLMLVENFR